MALAFATVSVYPATTEPDAFDDDVLDPTTPFITGLPASVIVRVTSTRRVEDDGTDFRVRAIIRVPYDAPTIEVGQSIMDERNGLRYLVRSIIEPTQFGRWRKIVAERDM